MKARSERSTQNRVVALFSDANHPNNLGYDYLGDWQQGERHCGLEVDLLSANLQQRGYSAAQISAALKKLQQAIDCTGSSLYQASLKAYQLLRYGVEVQVAVGVPHTTVRLIDWERPENNHFALAEEVTLKEGYERRPDLVLYLNGIAIAVIELKRSSVEVAEGVRQLISNQERIFNQGFFPTVQFLFAGNDSQGLHYGTTGTPEAFFVQWKSEAENRYPLSSAATPPAAVREAQVAYQNDEMVLGSGALLDRPLAQMCNKAVLLDLIKNFVIFDAGIKKVPRPHQYHGLKAAQERIRQREGGVIWHTQGSGKSILMVLLAKWVLESDPEARVLLITDRDELDQQISEVMQNAGVISSESKSDAPRVTSRAALIEKLSATTPRLLCALIHKFELDMQREPPLVQGRFYLFVDECHRTQGGKMNKQMKRWLKGAIFIGFTGTPLLRKDKKSTREVFGTYIHTYKFHQAVADRVVLDLKYEARDVPQRLSSPEKIDAWFEQKTKNLNKYQQALLRKQWTTLEKLMSSHERKQRIVASIIEDFSLKPRLNNDRGTAILVAASIYDACHYFMLFKDSTFGKYCRVITSYQPNHNEISREAADSDARYKFDTYTQEVLKSGESTKQYEIESKRQFIKEPAQCKLLIVVSKLLTGFDAPSCSYIYLDNELRDHNLFQAICRTNRLDGEDKRYGHIVDFKELFTDVQQAIAVYSSDELDVDSGAGDDNNVHLKDWLQEGRKNLEEAREAVKYLCEPVFRPKGIEEYIHYFCGDGQQANDLNETEVLRISFYKAVAAFVRAFAAIGQDLLAAGYSDAEIVQLNKEVLFFSDVRKAIKKYSGEELDIKPYEADMRHLINTYIHADSADPLGKMDDYSLVELIIETGIHDAIAKKLNQKGQLSQQSVAEGIVNNVRKSIVRETLTDPKFYQQISILLEDLIEQKKVGTLSYEAFLIETEKLVKKMADKGAVGECPEKLIGNPEAQVLFNNLSTIASEGFACPVGEEKAALALAIDRLVREKAPADWLGDSAREKQVLNEIFPVMARDNKATLAIFEIIKNQPDYQ